MDNLNTISFFEKVYKKEVSKTDQLIFIKKITDYELKRLQFLIHDLDIYLDNLHSENEEIPDVETLGNRLEELEAKGLEIPFMSYPNPEFQEALFNNEDISNIPEYMEDFLNVPLLLKMKKYYPLLVFRNHISQKIKFIEEKLIENDIDNSPTLDLSNTKATEKLIYLNELGIIDFLRKQEPFKHSVNKLATVLSAITDEKPTTLQPSLNSMLSYTNTPEKNPYNSKNTAPKVKAMLIELGYIINR